MNYVLRRVGHSLFGFLSESLVFCERNSDLLFSKSESLSSPFLKSDGSNSLLGIKRDKRVKKGKTSKNIVKTTNFFERITRFLRVKERRVKE